MARAIDADADVLISKKQLLVDLKANYQYMAVEIVNVQKPIDPVKHGKWNLITQKNIWDDLVDVFECSECKKYTTNGRGNTSPTDFCPNCGADMRGE